MARLLILLLVQSPLVVWAALWAPRGDAASVAVLALALVAFFGTIAWWIRRYGS